MKHEEHKIQCVIIQYLRLHKVFCFAIPNGGKRDAREGARLKREGVLAGVADIFIGENRGYFIEVKTEEGRQTQAQKDFERDTVAHGYEYKIWRSLDYAIRFVSHLNQIKSAALTLNNFTKEIKDIPPEYTTIVDDNFWKII